MLHVNDRERATHVLAALMHLLGDEWIDANMLCTCVMKSGKDGGVFGVYLLDASRHDAHPALDYAFTQLVKSGDIYYKSDQAHIHASKHILGFAGEQELQVFSSDEREQLCKLANTIRCTFGQRGAPAGD